MDCKLKSAQLEMEERNNLDTTTSLASILKHHGVHKQILSNLKSEGLEHPTILQKALLDLVGKKKFFVLEADSSLGKTIGAIFFALAELNLRSTTEPQKSIGLVVPNQKFINNVFSRLLTVFKHAPVRLINMDDDKMIGREIKPEEINIYIGSYSHYAKCFQEKQASLEDFGVFVLDDIDYSITLGNNVRLLQLCRYLKSQVAPEKQSFILISANTSLESFKEIKETFGVKFTNLKIVGEDAKNDEQEEQQEDQDGRAEILNSMMKQHYYLGTERHLFACLYLIAKFDVFKGPIMIVTEDLDIAYMLKVFLDRVSTGESQVYNTEGAVNIRAYNVALFNGNNIRYLIVPKVFLKDLKTNKNQVQTIRALKNIVFFDVELDYTMYNNYLNLFKGTQKLNTSNSVEMGYKVLWLVNQVLEGEEHKQKESLTNIMALQKDKFGRVLFQPLPIPASDIDAFTYSVGNVLTPITTKLVKTFRLIELKKLILKNKKMKEYFETHEAEKAEILKSLQKLCNRFEKNKNTIDGQVPFYLIPSFLKKQTDQPADAETSTKIEGPIKVVVSRTGSANKKGSKLKERFFTIDPEREDPDYMDASQLRSFSNRREWKRRHGYSQRNKRLSKKDIKKGKHI